MPPPRAQPPPWRSEPRWSFPLAGQPNANDEPVATGQLDGGVVDLAHRCHQGQAEARAALAPVAFQPVEAREDIVLFVLGNARPAGLQGQQQLPLDRKSTRL